MNWIKGLFEDFASVCVYASWCWRNKRKDRANGYQEQEPSF